MIVTPQNPPRTVIAGVQDEITSVVRRLNIRDSTAFAFPMRHICWFLERTFTLGQYGARVAEAAKRDPAWVLKILAAEHMRIPWISRFYVYYELCTQYVVAACVCVVGIAACRASVTRRHVLAVGSFGGVLAERRSRTK